MNSPVSEEFIQGIPKAELHLHIEGTLEPEIMFEIAARNRMQLPYPTVSDLRQAYVFGNLQDFLDIYYQGANVLQKEEDFYDLTMAYLRKAHSQNVKHVEIFFDPQTHTARGIDFKTVIHGIYKAMNDAGQQTGISTYLIMCFLRHLSEESALQTLQQSLPFRDRIIGVGLDSSELGHPPSKFRNVFARALDEGFMTVAHAGEEGPAEYIRDAIEILKVSRIDHGNNALNDESLLQRIIEREIPLTLCPLSNLKLKVVNNLIEHPLKTLLGKGVVATINSDDPAYFGGYVNENYLSIVEALGLSKAEVITLAKNSFTGSFLPEPLKNNFVLQIEQYASNTE